LSIREIRAIAVLTVIFSLRMLGLFLIMPVLSVYAKDVPGGESAVLVGLALGIYGLTQALFHLPYGWLSDRLGRKPVIVAGLLVFALGSAVAAGASNIAWIIVGRVLQGAGAISSVLIAFIADLTAEENRTKAMAIVGSSIGASFAIAIVAAPALFAWLGMSGLFTVIGLSALVAIGLLLWLVPPAPAVLATPSTHRSAFAAALRSSALWRLNLGVFVLHATQIALFIIVPRLLETAGLPIALHWKIYLPAILLSFGLMATAIYLTEKIGGLKTTMLAAIICLLLSQLVFIRLPDTPGQIAILLLIYFAGFNILEAVQPASVAKQAHHACRGAAMGVYNTAQALGYFVGGAAGGALLNYAGPQAVFIGCAGLLSVWFIVVFGSKT
jgi:MFS family permease